MAGFRMTIDDRVMQGRLSAIQDGLEDATALMRIWGETLQRSIARNFAEGGRPKWQRLARSTILRKGHARPLIGKTANLMKIVMKAESRRVVIGTQPSARDYAARQQFGWPGTGGAGRAGALVKTPARPFIKLQDEDKREMRESATSYLKRLAV